MYYYDKKFKKLNVTRVLDIFFILIEMNKILFNFKKIIKKSKFHKGLKKKLL